ncbi:MAG TPA: NosD domain-containing protein [Candidatus Binatia bacterium]|nr:NosD domain-containing protein [Candidatus Binatia bacterium]
MTTTFLLALLLTLPTSVLAADLFVPGQFSAIQDAIEAAPQGARIFVAAGRYVENIDFAGKAVSVIGAGPETIIDGQGVGPVVRFDSGESGFSMLDSVMVTGGSATQGGGILIVNSSPRVLRSVVAGNRASQRGSGILVSGAAAAPEILNNLVIFNSNTGSGDPHAIQVDSASPRIVNNTIVRNDSNAILTSGNGAPEIRNNILARNGSRSGDFGVRGRGICDFAASTVIQYNLFFRNVRSALLTAGRDFGRIRTAQAELGRERLAFNLDAAPRFSAGLLPRRLEDATPSDFVPSRERWSRAIERGDPASQYDNQDGTRNTIGFTGGPYAW